MKRIIFFTFFFGTLIANSQSWEKKLTANEELIAKGNYKKAKENVVKALTVLEKSPDQYQRLLLLAYAQYIKTQYHLSEYQEVDDKIKQSSEILENLQDSIKPQSFLLRTKLADAYSVAGEYQKAISLTDAVVNDSKSKELVKLKAFVIRTKAFADAKMILKANESVNEAGKLLSILDSKISETTDKKSKKELLNLKAEFLTSKAQVQLQAGDYYEAEKLATENKLWIKNQSKFSKLAKNQNHLVSAKAQYYLGQYKNSVKETRKGLKNLPWKYGKKSEMTQLELRKIAPLIFMEEEKSLKFARAVKDYEKCVRKFPESSVYRLQTKLFIAERYVFQYRYNKANASLNKNWNEAIKMPKSKELINAAKLREKVMLGLGHNEELLDTLNQLTSKIESRYGKESPVFQDLEMSKARIRQNIYSDFNFAKEVYKNGYFKVIAPNLNQNNVSNLEYFSQLAEFYFLTDKFDSSLMFVNKGLEAVAKNKGEKDLYFLTFLQKRAEVELKMGKYKDAQLTLERAVKLVKSIPGEKNAEKANAYELLAKLYETLGQFAKARDAIKISKKLSAKAKYRKDPDVAKSKDEMANIMIKTGRYSAAEKLLIKTLAEKEAKAGKESRAMIPTLNLFGYLYTTLGRYPEAEKMLVQSAGLIERIFGKNSLAYSENAKFFEKLYLSLGDYDKALEKAITNLEIKKKVLSENHLETIEASLDLIKIQIEKSENPKELEKFIPEVTSLGEKTVEIIGVEHPMYAEILKTKALLYIKSSNNFLQADTLIGTAINTIEKVYGNESPEEAEALMIKGETQKKLEKLKESERSFRKAQKTYASVFNTKHPGYVRATGKLAQILYAEKQYDQSMKLMESCVDNYLKFTNTYFKTLSAREKNKYWSLIKPDLEFFNSAALQQMKQNPKMISKLYNNILQTKGILLSNSQKVRQRILTSNNDELIKTYENWVEKREKLTELLASATNENAQEIEILETDAENLEKKLSELSEDFKKSVKEKAVTWQQVKEKLKDGEYAVEITKIRHFEKDFTDSSTYVALIVHNKTKDNPELVVINSGKVLDGRYIKYYRNTMKQKSDDKLSYKYFWKPIADKIPQNSKIYLSSDGSFNQLNVESLLDSTQTPIINYYDFVQISSTRDIVTFTASSSYQNKDVLLIANPEFYTKSPKTPMVVPLKGAEDEAKEISNLLKTKGWSPELLMGKSASKDVLKETQKHRVIHIATHGFFKEDIDYIELSGVETAKDPLLRSGLMFKGAGDNTESLPGTPSGAGILTAYEAMNLNLDNTEVVLMSACETGLGEVQVGEGVFGLQRAFLVAGADALVMSLFKVDDEATKLLMKTFYENWLESGNKHQAFEKARQKVAQKFKHPAFWGSFVLLGME
ncbi:MAG: CHAT domain-containing protein [Cytophagales bacterium]